MVLFVFKSPNPFALCKASKDSSSGPVSAGGSPMSRTGTPCLSWSSAQSSHPAVSVVKGSIHLPNGCDDKSPAITGSKAITTTCFNRLANFPCYEISSPFLGLKGTDYEDISHFSLFKYIIFTICLVYFRLDLFSDELAFLQGNPCAS